MPLDWDDDGKTVPFCKRCNLCDHWVRFFIENGTWVLLHPWCVRKWF